MPPTVLVCDCVPSGSRRELRRGDRCKSELLNRITGAGIGGRGGGGDACRSSQTHIIFGAALLRDEKDAASPPFGN